MKKNKQLRITLIRSRHGRLPNHKACIKGLGLKRINQAVVVEDTLCTRGMIDQVSYLLRVEEL